MREVLIADDHPLFRDALARAVTQAVPDVSLHQADSVAALLNLIENHPHAELLLLDLHMPGISGVELLRMLRSRGVTRPVIVISGRRDPAQDAEVWAAGATALLSKPFDDQQLLDLIAQAKIASE